MANNIRLREIRPGKWQYDFYLAGKRHIRVVTGTKSQADSAARRHWTKLDKERTLTEEFGIAPAAIKANTSSFREIADQFFSLYCMRKRSWSRDKTSIDHLKDFFGDKRFSEITLTDLDEYKLDRSPSLDQKRKAKGEVGVSPASLNRECAVLKTLIGWAEDRGWAVPFRKSKVRLEVEEARDYTVLDAAEAQALLDAASPSLVPILVVALGTGMRKSEILSLEWANVNLHKLEIRIPVENSKSKKERVIPMSSRVYDVLISRPKDGRFVFPSPTNPDRPLREVQTSWNTARTNAGLSKMWFHDLRHTAISWMVNEGHVDLVTVSKIVGHSTIQMTARYVHPNAAVRREAVEFLAKKLERKPERPAESTKTAATGASVSASHLSN